MRDRIPTPGKANRVKITKDDGAVVEGVLSYADDATQEGSAYNKANVLPDDVCETLGLTGDPEPKDAFRLLYKAARVPQNYCRLIITVTHEDGTPWVDCQLAGIADVDADDLVTDSKGVLAVNVTGESYTITPVTESEYFDKGINPFTVQTPVGTVVEVSVAEESLEVKRVNINSSRTVKWSADVAQVDVFCVGGGGGGAGGGGGGGYTATKLNVTPTAGVSYPAIVGAGGKGAVAKTSSTPASPATAGGTTSFMGCSAAGGGCTLTGNGVIGADGGSGGGSPGYYGKNTGYTPPGEGGTNGGNGGKGDHSYGGTGQGTTTKPFGDETEEIPYAGGGAGALYNGRTSVYGPVSGGHYGGGDSASVKEDNVVAPPKSGLPNTGGGGGGIGDGYGSYPGGDGGSGVIIVRWRNKT